MAWPLCRMDLCGSLNMAPVVRTYTFPGPNLTPAETWATGLRTPYGLAFVPDGSLWELEHGPGGTDVHLSRPEPDTRGDMGHRLTDSLWPGLCAGWTAVGA